MVNKIRKIKEYRSRIERLEKEIDELSDYIHTKMYSVNMIDIKTIDEYDNICRDEKRKLNELNRKLRMIEPYNLSDIPNYGDIMSLEHFIDCVKSGGFIDYDGFGRYIDNDRMTSIEIYPSDIKHDSIRKGFDNIIWFNR